MNIQNRKQRDRQLANYLCTIVDTKPNGKPIYRTLEEAGVRFNLCATHVARIKRALIGSDVDGIRKLKDE